MSDMVLTAAFTYNEVIKCQEIMRAALAATAWGMSTFWQRTHELFLLSSLFDSDAIINSGYGEVKAASTIPVLFTSLRASFRGLRFHLQRF